MNTPPQLVEWLSEKTTKHRWAGVGEPRTVTHTWRRQTGGMVMSATLSASIKPSEQFVMNVDSPNIDANYVAAAKNAVFSVLLSQNWSPVLACTITLFAFEPHKTESSYAAYYAVAKEATEQLLGLAPGFSHNIRW